MHWKVSSKNLSLPPCCSGRNSTFTSYGLMRASNIRKEHEEKEQRKMSDEKKNSRAYCKHCDTKMILNFFFNTKIGFIH